MIEREFQLEKENVRHKMSKYKGRKYDKSVLTKPYESFLSSGLVEVQRDKELLAKETDEDQIERHIRDIKGQMIRNEVYKRVIDFAKKI
jgi:hypothetical protein